MLLCQVHVSPLFHFFHHCFFLSTKAGSLLCYLSWQGVHLWFYILCVSCTWHSLTDPSGFASVSLRKGFAGSRELSFPVIPQPLLVTILQILVIRKKKPCAACLNFSLIKLCFFHHCSVLHSIQIKKYYFSKRSARNVTLSSSGESSLLLKSKKWFSGYLRAYGKVIHTLSSTK